MMIPDTEESQGYFTSTVALVTAFNRGKINVMAAEWSLRVSLEPFLMAVFVGYERATYSYIHESKEFGLSYCSEDQGELAHIAGNYSAFDTDKFSLARFHMFQGRYIKAPLVDGCISNFECRIIDEFKTGDHAAFIGEVLQGYYDPEKKPLVFHKGKFHHIGERIKH